MSAMTRLGRSVNDQPRRTAMTLALILFLGLGGCRGAPPAATTTVPTPLPAAPAAERPPERRSPDLATIDPFPRATTTVADGQAVLWAPWPMEGRDLQRTNRGPIVGPHSGHLLWSVAIDEPSFGQVVQGADGTLYVGTMTGKVQAVRPREGVSWSFAATPPVPTPALGPDGTVYLRGGDGTLFALRPDGRRRWTTDIGAEPQLLGPAPLVGPDSYGYLASYHQGLVYLTQPGGFFEWAVNTGARTLAGPAVGPDGTIFAGAADGSLRALDREAVERWRADLGVPITSAPAIDPSGRLHVLAGEGPSELVAVAPDGRVAWRTPACWGRGAPVLWPALASDGRVQVGACAIGASGAVRWSAAIAATWTTSSTLDADGQAFLAAGRAVYGIDANGSISWRLDLDSAELMPPSLGSAGTLYVAGARPHRLYAIGAR